MNHNNQNIFRMAGRFELVSLSKSKTNQQTTSDWEERSGSTEKSNYAIYNWNSSALGRIAEALVGICRGSKIKKKAGPSGMLNLIESIKQRNDWYENDIGNILKVIEFLKSMAINSGSDESKKQRFLQKIDLWATKAKECWYAMYPAYDGRNLEEI